MAPFSGGMEHQTMTSIGFFDFEIDAHELLHQWFGDNVTCATWKDIFVNEGFASYGEYLADYYLKTPATGSQKMLDVHTSVMAHIRMVQFGSPTQLMCIANI
jgi:aminopeptidase N